MDNYLYFIPLLARALQQADSGPALKQAFAEIERLGRQPEYEQGYRQFRRFMVTGARSRPSGEGDVPDLGFIHWLISELATGTLDGDQGARRAALELIRSQPKWQEEYEQLCCDLDRPARPTDVLVTREDEPIGTITFEDPAGAGSVGNIVPGRYSLALDTGRVIWEGPLSKRDLLWAHAYPDHPLELAADTGETSCPPTREFSLLDGELTLRVYAGVEGGRLELEVRKAGGAPDAR